MADIRIKDLATTASTTASDDFLAVDGTTNGTRKLSAATPTFLTSVTTPSLTSPASTNLTLGLGTGGTALTLTSSTLAATFAGAVTTANKFAVSAYASNSFLTGNGSGFLDNYYNGGSGFDTMSLGVNYDRRNNAISSAIVATGDLRFEQGTGGQSNFVIALGGTNTVPTDRFTIASTGNATFAGAVTHSGATTLSGPTTASYTSNAPNPASLVISPTFTNSLASYAYGISSSPVGTQSNSGAGLYGAAFGASLTAASTSRDVGGIEINPISVGTSTVTNAYGMLINNISGATNNFAIKTGLGRVSIGDTTPSTGAGSGALQVAGGIYAGAASYFGGDLNVTRASAGLVAAQIYNSTSGTGAISGLEIRANNHTGIIYSLSDAFTSSGQYLASGTILEARGSAGLMLSGYTSGPVKIWAANGLRATFDASAATFAGAVAINNTVATAVAVASTHKVTMVIGGVTYYLLASNV